MLTRRTFLAMGIAIPFEKYLPKGIVPLAYGVTPDVGGLEGTDGLSVLNDRPLNAETPPHLLDDEITPASRLFIRNNGLLPDIAKATDFKDWRLTIDGEVKKTLSLSLEDLKKFKSYTYHLVLECAGNGRAGYVPAAPGNQWTYGGVGCPQWTGVRLKDILESAGLKPSAVYIGYYGLDVDISGDPEKVVISRGVPIAKALDNFTLVAFQMNGGAIPAVHGAPARLICPGYPASASGKWLKRITVRDKVHDGPKMTGMSYRMPKNPVKPGATVPETDMLIIEKMPVKSLITFPKSGIEISESKRAKFECRGFAWTSELKVTDVHVSYDFGQTWNKTSLKPAKNRFGWSRWETTLSLPSKGYYEIWARATDNTGKEQPMVVPGWNPEGYLNNAMPRIAVLVS